MNTREPVEKGFPRARCEIPSRIAVPLFAISNIGNQIILAFSWGNKLNERVPPLSPLLPGDSFCTVSRSLKNPCVNFVKRTGGEVCRAVRGERERAAPWGLGIRAILARLPSLPSMPVDVSNFFHLLCLFPGIRGPRRSSSYCCKPTRL